MLEQHLPDIFQPHDPGDGIAGVLVGSAVFVADRGIKIFKVVVPDHDLAPDGIGIRLQRHGLTGCFQLDQFDLVRDILPGLAVAPGGKDPFAPQGGDPVIFRLDQQRFLRGAANFFAQAMTSSSE